jgi:hypothetical protein
VRSCEHVGQEPAVSYCEHVGQETALSSCEVILELGFHDQLNSSW